MQQNEPHQLGRDFGNGTLVWVGMIPPLGHSDDGRDTASTDPPPAVSENELATMVAVDFAADDTPERCSWCPGWRFEWVDINGEVTVLREWHLLTCPVPISWGIGVGRDDVG